MPQLQRTSSPELKGLYANSNRFTQPKGTIPRVSNLYMIRRGAFHTVAGSQWVSSYDGLAPHSTAQMAIESLTWYSPSPSSGPDVYMAGMPNVTAHNFVMAMQLDSTPGVLDLQDVSTGTFSLLAQVIPADLNGPFTAVQYGDYLITGLGNSVPPMIFPLVTQLSASVGSTDTALPVLTTAGFPSSGFVIINSEAIQYASITGSHFEGVTRGVLGTAAATHANAAQVAYGVDVASAFVAQPWNPITNVFSAGSLYGFWPGTANANGASVSVNIGTVILASDGQQTPWLWRAQNSGFTGSATGYWGPPFWPGGVNGGGNMTSGSGVLTAVNNAPFVAAMASQMQPITVDGAGPAGAPLTTTVVGFTSSTQVTLAATASTTVSAAPFNMGTGNVGDVAPDFAQSANTGTEVWVNIGRASFNPPGAAFVFQHLNFVFLWGVGSTYGADGITGPDALWQSDFGSPSSFNPANTTFVGKGDGTSAQGGAEFSLSEAGIAATPQLVLFKDASTYSFINSFPTNEQLVPVSGGLGCISPGTIQFIGGYGIMRLSYAGFALFDGQLEHVTEYTDAIQGYLFGGLSDVTAVDFANIKHGVSTQSVNPPSYAAFLPLVGGTGFATRGFLYDWALKQWTIMDLPFAISAASFNPQAAVALAVKYQSLIAGSVDGAVRRIFAGDSDWDGTPINWSLQLVDMGYPGTPIYVRRINIRLTFDGGGAAPSLTSVSFSGVKRSGTQYQRALNTPISIRGSMDVGDVVLSGSVAINGQGQVVMEGTDSQTSDKPMTRIGL